MKKISQRKKEWIERTVSNDRSYKRFLYNRFYLFALLVILQLAAAGYLLYLFAYNSRAGFIVQLVVGVLAAVCVLYILNKTERASSRLSWIMLILVLPIFGVPLYLACGEGRPAWKMKRKLDKAEKRNSARWQMQKGEEAACPTDRAQGVEYYLDREANAPAYHDGTVTYYDGGKKMFPEMLVELEKAESFIFLEYFIIAHGKMWGEILKVLLRKAEEGVKIRIIYDDFGCMTTLPPQYDRYLSTLHENVKAITFNEVVPMFAVRMNNRDHRKMLIIDGKVAFTGGINLADEYIGEKRRFGFWKDTGVKITGSAVQSCIYSFCVMWNAFCKEKEDVNAYLPTPNEEKTERVEGLTIQPYGDSPLDGKSVGESVYLDMINRAVRYVYIFTPYLLLDDILRSALTHAAERGVDVRIVTPGIPDKKLAYRLTRANYGILLKTGVKIYEYTPGFIHAKSLVCDDESAVVGTINFDYRSLYFHFENAVYFAGCEAVTDLKRDCEETFAVSKLCTKENTKRGMFGRLIDSVLRLLETLM